MYMVPTTKRGEVQTAVWKKWRAAKEGSGTELVYFVWLRTSATEVRDGQMPQEGVDGNPRGELVIEGDAEHLADPCERKHGFAFLVLVDRADRDRSRRDLEIPLRSLVGCHPGTLRGASSGWKREPGSLAEANHLRRPR